MAWTSIVRPSHRSGNYPDDVHRWKHASEANNSTAHASTQQGVLAAAVSPLTSRALPAATCWQKCVTRAPR